jgi:TctA family transporter
MEEVVNLFHGFAVAIQPFNLMVMVVGIMLGVIIGVLPGLGGANGVAILLPLTFSMSPTSAIIMLSCIYWGALFGGAITSVLFNILRRPSDGAAGQGGRGADRRLHVVVRGRAVRGDHDHAGGAAGCEIRAAVRTG